MVGPSNPVISIGPILAVPGMRELLASATAPVVAVSPFVAGAAIKGPTDEFMRAIGQRAVRVAGVAAAYGELLDGLVVDAADPDPDPDVAGIRTTRVDTLMDGPDAPARGCSGDPRLRGLADRLRDDPTMLATAILPIKRFGEAKSRLAETPAEALRPTLARAMLADVLAGSASATCLERIVVVSGEPAARSSPTARGRSPRRPRRRRALGGALGSASPTRSPTAPNAWRCSPGDCPLLEPVELDRLLERAGARGRS